jgi:peptidoglycan hydrolase CwlO-like protein
MTLFSTTHQVNVNVTFNLSDACVQSLAAALGEILMSALGPKLDELEASIDAALTRVQDDVTALQAKIDELQAKVDQGLATPDELARLDTLKAKLDALDPVNPATLPEETP